MVVSVYPLLSIQIKVSIIAVDADPSNGVTKSSQIFSTLKIASGKQYTSTLIESIFKHSKLSVTVRYTVFNPQVSKMKATSAESGPVLFA